MCVLAGSENRGVLFKGYDLDQTLRMDRLGSSGEIVDRFDRSGDEEEGVTPSLALGPI